MNVLIDVSGITRQKTGVGVYALELLQQLTRTSSISRIYILAQDDDADLDLSDFDRVTMLWVPARVFRILPLRMLLEQIYLPYLLARFDIDVAHSVHYTLPCIAAGARRIVTFHDMTFFLFPELHQTIKIVYFRSFMRIAIRSADGIIFVSRSAKDDCDARLGEPAGRSFVIPHGADAGFAPLAPGANIDSLLLKYKIPTRFVLYIGTIEPRKNLHRLVEAFAPLAASDPEIALVIAGKMGWMMEDLARTIARLGLVSRVCFTGFVLDEEKPLLLGACTLFVYPSLYEGFGLPALEALACGAPTITSNTSSLPEVVGDAAILVDPKSIHELTMAMELLLNDADLRDELRRRGPAQARKFTWQACAEATVKAYLAVAANKPDGAV